MHYEWCKDIQTKSKLRNYVKFNQDIETSGYLKISLPRFLRLLMAQLRLGILALDIETKHQLKTDFANYAKMKILRMKSTFSDVVNILTTSVHYFLLN